MWISICFVSFLIYCAVGLRDNLRKMKRDEEFAKTSARMKKFWNSVTDNDLYRKTKESFEGHYSEQLETLCENTGYHPVTDGKRILYGWSLELACAAVMAKKGKLPPMLSFSNINKGTITQKEERAFLERIYLQLEKDLRAAGVNVYLYYIQTERDIMAGTYKTKRTKLSDFVRQYGYGATSPGENIEWDPE